MKVAIAGATGFVGSRLVEKLQAAGHQVVVLSRDAARARRVFPASAYPNLEVVAYTPASSGDWQKSIAGCDGVVNFLGFRLWRKGGPRRASKLFWTVAD